MTLYTPERVALIAAALSRTDAQARRRVLRERIAAIACTLLIVAAVALPLWRLTQ